MSYELTRQVIEAQFQATFTVAHIAWDGQPNQIDNSTPYVALFIEYLTNNRTSVGEKQTRIIGVLTIQCFAPMDTESGSDFIGKAGSLRLADAAEAAIRGQDFGGVVIEDSDLTRVGVGDAFYQFNVAIRFHRDVSN